MNMKTFCVGIVLLMVAPLILASSRAAATTITHQWDDGSFDTGLGAQNVEVVPQDIVWLNVFDAAAGGETITKVSAVFAAHGFPFLPGLSNFIGGEPVTFIVWSDPTNDGNPADAILLTSQGHNVTNFSNNVTPDVVSLTTPVVVTGKFFVGVLFTNTTVNAVYFPALADSQTLAAGRSWSDFGPAGGSFDLNDLSTGNFSTFTWLLRAEGETLEETSAVPEPGTLVLAALGLLGLSFVTLRKKFRRA